MITRNEKTAEAKQKRKLAARERRDKKTKEWKAIFANESDDHKKGLQAGKNASRHNRKIRTHFKNKSEAYIKGYNEGYLEIQQSLTLKEREFNSGKKLGQDRARVGLNKMAADFFIGKSEDYIQGYNQGYDKVQKKITPSDVQYNLGKVAGSKDALIGSKRTEFFVESDDFIRGYDAGHTLAASKVTEAQCQYNHGWRNGRFANRTGLKHPDFEGRSEDYIKGYKEGYAHIEASKSLHNQNIISEDEIQDTIDAIEEDDIDLRDTIDAIEEENSTQKRYRITDTTSTTTTSTHALSSLGIFTTTQTSIVVNSNKGTDLDSDIKKLPTL